jgi:predicted DNA-binding transcriptional regulator AlpA
MVNDFLSIKINGNTYFPATEVIKKLGIARQTLWRWRQEGKIPPGHRYRDKQLLFTSDEVEAIVQFANRIEPISHDDEHQLRLFGSKKI